MAQAAEGSEVTFNVFVEGRVYIFYIHIYIANMCSSSFLLYIYIFAFTYTCLGMYLRFYINMDLTSSFWQSRKCRPHAAPQILTVVNVHRKEI